MTDRERSPRAWVGWLLAALAVTGAVLGLGSADATFPGRNGKIIYGDDAPCDDSIPATGRCGGQYLAAVDPREPGRKRRLTCGGPKCRALNPDVSPNGRRILYEGDERNREILVSDIDGSRTRLVTAGYSPAWGPRGRRFVFISPGRKDVLMARRVAGGRSRRITPGLFPDWSSRGQIAFVRFDRRHRPDVYLSGIYGRKVRRLTRGGRSGAPHWSPDGRWLVIERISRRGSSNVVILDRRGRLVRKVTRKRGETPAWSPDGKEIVFYRREGFPATESLYVVGAWGGGLRRIARYLGSSGGIDWAPRAGQSD